MPSEKHLLLRSSAATQGGRRGRDRACMLDPAPYQKVLPKSVSLAAAAGSRQARGDRFAHPTARCSPIGRSVGRSRPRQGEAGGVVSWRALCRGFAGMYAEDTCFAQRYAGRAASPTPRQRQSYRSVRATRDTPFHSRLSTPASTPARKGVSLAATPLESFGSVPLPVQRCVPCRFPCRFLTGSLAGSCGFSRKDAKSAIRSEKVCPKGVSLATGIRTLNSAPKSVFFA